jgi:hypothetical protein
LQSKKLDVSNLDLMLAVAELMFLNFRLGGASLAVLRLAVPLAEMMKICY